MLGCLSELMDAGGDSLSRDLVRSYLHTHNLPLYLGYIISNTHAKYYGGGNGSGSILCITF